MQVFIIFGSDGAARYNLPNGVSVNVTAHSSLSYIPHSDSIKIPCLRAKKYSKSDESFSSNSQVNTSLHKLVALKHTGAQAIKGVLGFPA